MEFNFKEYAEDLEVPEESLVALMNPDTGIFYGVDEKTIRKWLLDAEAIPKKRGQTVFKQGESTDGMPLYIIVSGEFSVTHQLREDVCTQIATDLPGVLLADVELLVQDIDCSVYMRGKTNCALSTVTCTKDGVILAIPQKIVQKTDSVALAFNLAKLVAIKLLRRNADGDEDKVQERRRIIEYLHKQIKEHGVHQNTGPDHKLRPYIASAHFSQVMVAEALHLAKSTVNSFYLDKLYVWHKSKEFVWEDKIIEMSEAMFRQILDDPLALAAKAKPKAKGDS